MVCDEYWNIVVFYGDYYRAIVFLKERESIMNSEIKVEEKGTVKMKEDTCCILPDSVVYNTPQEPHKFNMCVCGGADFLFEKYDNDGEIGIVIVKCKKCGRNMKAKFNVKDEELLFYDAVKYWNIGNPVDDTGKKPPSITKTGM